MMNAPSFRRLTARTVMYFDENGTPCILEFFSPMDAEGNFGDMFRYSFRDGNGKWIRKWCED